jgi:hypothetical protein
LAQANPVTYVFTGVADGNVGGTGFTAETYRFSVTGDSATVQNSSPPFSNVLNGGRISITNTACAGGCTITSPGSYLVFNTATNPTSFVHGISLTSGLDQPGSTLIEGCWDCGPPTVNDDLVTNVPPTPSGDENALAPYLTFATSGGNVQITNLDSHITYSVVASVIPSSIPSLSLSGLILLAGLLALATVVALRRRWPTIDERPDEQT